jgi:hypothetical protein
MAVSKRLSTAVLTLLCVVGGTCDCSLLGSPAEKKTLVAKEKLTEWIPEERETIWDATLTFVSDETLVLQLCHPAPSSKCPLLLVLQILDSGFRTLARRESTEERMSLFRTEQGGIVAVFNGANSSQLFSTDLNLKYRFSYTPWHISLSGKTAAGIVSNNAWTIVRICASLDCAEEVRRVKGELESVSDDAVVLREHDTIQVQTLQGTQIGTFKVKPKSKCATELQIVGQGRLFLQSCGPDRIVDFHGKEIKRFRHPQGWSHRRGWSVDGTRVLYDTYTRTVPALQSVGEVAIAVVTLGAGVADENANGEAVRVVDTTTATTCFEWHDPKNLVDEGVYHADISPSGQLVALVTRGELLIYRLPRRCEAE